jgi:poly [ADP-ribose] polymerase
MGKIVKLINVSAQNNNKFYDMKENDDGTWTASYGRVGYSGAVEQYPMSNWDKKYKEKIKKGYKDITGLVSVASEEDNVQLKIESVSDKVSTFVQTLQNFAKETVKANYTVAAESVTEKQVQSAQEILDKLVGMSDKTNSVHDVNTNLLELYKTIPRKMKNTKDHLLGDTFDSKFFKELLSNEQDLLDVMRGQVGTVKKIDKAFNLADLFLHISEAQKEDLARIKKETDFIVGKADNVFVVNHSKHSEEYDKHPIENNKLLYHGSRNENWWSIINTGLKIRPANAILTGSMFGPGIYTANKAQKSLGYSSLSGSYWAKGSSHKGYLGLYEVNLGRVWNLFEKENYSNWMSRIDNKTCKSKNFDSVFAKGGADLRNDEFIIYEEFRCKIKYLIEINK